MDSISNSRELFIIEIIINYLQTAYPDIYSDKEIIRKYIEYNKLHNKYKLSETNKDFKLTDFESERLGELNLLFYGNTDGSNSTYADLPGNYLLVIRTIKQLINSTDSSIKELISTIYSLFDNKEINDNDEFRNYYLNSIVIPSLLNAMGSNFINKTIDTKIRREEHKFDKYETIHKEKEEEEQRKKEKEIQKKKEIEDKRKREKELADKREKDKKVIDEKIKQKRKEQEDKTKDEQNSKNTKYKSELKKKISDKLDELKFKLSLNIPQLKSTLDTITSYKICKDSLLNLVPTLKEYKNIINDICELYQISDKISSEKNIKKLKELEKEFDKKHKDLLKLNGITESEKKENELEKEITTINDFFRTDYEKYKKDLLEILKFLSNKKTIKFSSLKCNMNKLDGFIGNYLISRYYFSNYDDDDNDDLKELKKKFNTKKQDLQKNLKELNDDNSSAPLAQAASAARAADRASAVAGKAAVAGEAVAAATSAATSAAASAAADRAAAAEAASADRAAPAADRAAAAEAVTVNEEKNAALEEFKEAKKAVEEAIKVVKEVENTVEEAKKALNAKAAAQNNSVGYAGGGDGVKQNDFIELLDYFKDLEFFFKNSYSYYNDYIHIIIKYFIENYIKNNIHFKLNPDNNILYTSFINHINNTEINFDNIDNKQEFIKLCNFLKELLSSYQTNRVQFNQVIINFLLSNITKIREIIKNLQINNVEDFIGPYLSNDEYIKLMNSSTYIDLSETASIAVSKSQTAYFSVSTEKVEYDKLIKFAKETKDANNKLLEILQILPRAYNSVEITAEAEAVKAAAVKAAAEVVTKAAEEVLEAKEEALNVKQKAEKTASLVNKLILKSQKLIIDDIIKYFDSLRIEEQQQENIVSTNKHKKEFIEYISLIIKKKKDIIEYYINYFESNKINYFYDEYTKTIIEIITEISDFIKKLEGIKSDTNGRKKIIINKLKEYSKKLLEFDIDDVSKKLKLDEYIKSKLFNIYIKYINY